MRGLAVDISPLRRSRDFRMLWLGELVSTMGRQITVVALPFQVYLLTRSTLAVGMIGLVEVVPLVASTIAGGAIADRMDRRKLILGTEFGLVATSALLLAGVLAGQPHLWYLYTVAGLQAAIAGLNNPSRSAAVPSLVAREHLPAALALNQVLFTSSMIVGPSVAGLILGAFGNTRTGLAWAYGTDIATFTVAIGSVIRMRPIRPKRDEALMQGASGWGEIKDGFAYLRGQRTLIATFLIDLDAMIFGMPRALFPVLALTVFNVGPRGLGLL